MVEIANLFTAGFLLVTATSLLLAGYVIKINPEGKENWIFAISIISIAIWSFGLGCAMSAPTEDISVIFRRVSAVGWGTFSSLILHFALEITEKKKLLKKRWTYVLIYLPALINLMVFAIPTGLNKEPFNMMSSDIGWININDKGPWDIYYIISIISLFTFSLIIVGHWGLKTKEESKKRHAIIIVFSFVFGLLVATLTDIIANEIFETKVPQIAPIIILLPMTAIYVSMRRYGFLRYKNENKPIEILTISSRKILYHSLSFIMILGGSFVLLLYHLEENGGCGALNSVLPLGLIILGGCLEIINRIKADNKTKDTISTFLLSILIPLLTLNSINKGSITVWAFPFVLIIIALLFNRKRVLWIIAFMTLITQIIVWMISPEISITLKTENFIGRMFIFTAGITVALMVNRMYHRRLKENADQMARQALISEISTDFVTADQRNIDEMVRHMLAKAGAYFEVDLACFHPFDESAKSDEYSWIKPGVYMDTEKLQRIWNEDCVSLVEKLHI